MEYTIKQKLAALCYWLYKTAKSGPNSSRQDRT